MILAVPQRVGPPHFPSRPLTGQWSRGPSPAQAIHHKKNLVKDIADYIHNARLLLRQAASYRALKDEDIEAEEQLYIFLYRFVT